MQQEVSELFWSSTACPSVYRDQRNHLLDAVTDFLQVKPVWRPASNGKIETPFVATEIPSAPIPSEEYFDQLVQRVLQSSVNMASPWCLGHMTGALPNFVPALTQFVVTLNQNLVKRDASRTLSLVERQAVAMMHRLVFDFPADFYAQHVQNDASTLGLMAGGGTLANLTSLWLARDKSFPQTGEIGGASEDGLSAVLKSHGYRGAAVIASELMHYSIEKAVSLSGIGSRNLYRVAVDSAHRMNTDALRRVVEECRRTGRKIVMIVGIAGTTESGSVDPLEEIAAVARDAGAHFHVDAAWGGPLLFSRRHRHLLNGIGLADSVTMDGHKQLYLPIGTSMLLLRDPGAAGAIEKRSRYILREGSGDLGMRSVEGSRDGAALFVHAALNMIGASGYEQLMDANLDRAKEMAAHIRGSVDFELLLDPPTNIVLYRYIPPKFRGLDQAGRFSGETLDIINQCNTRIQQAQECFGRTFVARTEFHQLPISNGKPIVALRAVVSNPRLTMADIRFVLEDQIHIAADI